VFLSGLGGNDTLLGSAKDDTLLGGDGNDSLEGGQGVNTLDGGTGDDTLYGGRFGDSSETGGAGADHFALDFGGTARVTDFSSGVDKIRLDGNLFSSVGASGDYSAGDVRFYSAAGATAAHDADDRFVYDSSTGNMYYDADGTGAGSAQFLGTLQGAPSIGATDVEVINGTSPTPTPTPGTSLNGTNNADTLVGGAGNDTIFGNSGNDWIEGRGGNDQLSGGSGQDSYVFREFGASNADTLLNFDSNWDAMRFDNAAFTALGADGHFVAGDARFFAAAGASAGHDADDRIVYNTSTGQLYYDADGAGGADAQLVATIQGGGTVAAQDIWVI
jgi:Ca2+-binding RTX toxin-like protein